MVLHQAVVETVPHLMEILEEVQAVEAQLVDQVVQIQGTVAEIQKTVLQVDLHRQNQLLANQK